MTKSTICFESQRDLADVAAVLMRLNNIKPGRDIVWLLDDVSATDNSEAVEHWLRAEIWRRQIDCEDVDLKLLSNALQKRLFKALGDME